VKCIDLSMMKHRRKVKKFENIIRKKATEIEYIKK